MTFGGKQKSRLGKVPAITKSASFQPITRYMMCIKEMLMAQPGLYANYFPGINNHCNLMFYISRLYDLFF
ncbi:MAG TPA: hypothetical protein DEO70_11130 [Bacteroidales bacterium]|nr:MAG: hypothetical protein A2X11_05640 [Bacteroidetes bacterium GWE2_42_24]OFY30508.1 MAG: hypothetical protein A2X09_16620 [Bacteroidetes bacterium GWF2_43_11]HBZ67380.1 hypothetical protein [Bacteroidales bacterium]